jgi:hypothetical protein
MFVGRLLGWLVILGGLIVLGRDLLAWRDGGEFQPIVLGQLWFDLHPASLELLQPAIQRHIHPALWDWVVQPVLLSYAFPTLLILGLVLLFLCRRRAEGSVRRRRRR